MKRKLIIIISCILITNLYIWPKKDEAVLVNEAASLPKEFTVTILGEVVYPGIYTFYSEINLREVINYAGGITKEADEIIVNYNEIIKANKTINIKRLEQGGIDELITTYNLNEISKKELLDLVGVINGLTLNRAINIILYRQTEGLFNDVSDLLKVKEIGPSTYEKINKYFKV